MQYPSPDELTEATVQRSEVGAGQIIVVEGGAMQHEPVVGDCARTWLEPMASVARSAPAAATATDRLDRDGFLVLNGPRCMPFPPLLAAG